MAQVARRAGVHPSTVSLALRNHPSIPPATRERIREAVAEMGYRPDPVLNALTAYRRARTPHREVPLAYLTHWDSEWGWKQCGPQARFHAGAGARAEELGYKLEHFWLGEPGLSPRRMNGILQARGIAGLLVASHLPEHDRPLLLDWPKFSAVKIDCPPKALALHHVATNHLAIVRLAVARIRAAGYRRIGMVMPHWWDELADLAWSAGFLAEQQRIPPTDRIPILHFSMPAAGGLPAAMRETTVPSRPFAEWLREHRPEVLLAKSQFVQPQLEALGLVVPRDLAFVELHLDPDARAAGVRHNCERVGALAAESLVGQLQQNTFGMPEVPTALLVEGTWVDGETLPLLSERLPLDAAARPRGDL